jgi:hypothetical protein
MSIILAYMMDKTIKIISNTPVYVWVLLAYLMWGGLRARKTYMISWKALLAMPLIMLSWSLYANVKNYPPLSLCLWGVSITLGIWLGTLTVRHLGMRFDKQKQLIEIAGNWTPLILSISIFALRYFLGTTYGLHPELRGNGLLLGIENIATIVSGMFSGRLLGYWKKYKASPHKDLTENKT